MLRHALSLVLAATVAVSAAVGCDGRVVKKPMQDATSGTLTGSIIYAGSPPKPGVPDEYVNKDECCEGNKARIKDESLIVGPKGGLANVIVYLARKPKGYTPPPAPKKPLVFRQKFCTYVPHVMVVRTGRPISIQNDDATTHNVHVAASHNFQEYGKVIGPTPAPIVYARPEPVPVKIKCDIHGWMTAYHLPLDHPFGAVTTKNGTFTIKGLPAGTHRINIWHEKAGWLARNKSVTIHPGETTELNLRFGPEKFADRRDGRPHAVTLSQR